jgi:hypothetical protein
MRILMTQPARSILPLVGGLLLAGLATLPGAPAYAQKPKAPQWAYAFDLSCRKLGEQEFTKDTKKFGVEVFRDANNGLGIYLTQAGSLAVVASLGDVKVPLKDSKAPEWVAGLDLKARGPGEQEFTKDTKTYSMEVFHDGNAGNWLYITEHGVIAAAAGRREAAPAGPKAPQWLHSMDLRCRKAGQKEWLKETPAFGLEVYKDVNTGNLIYITNTGSVAAVSGVEAPAEPPKEGKAPQWLHGLDLQVRRVGEKDFTKATGKVGVEIFRDANNGNLILITETGNIAVAAAGRREFKTPTPNPRDARFTHGLDLSVRQAGEKDFTDKTRSYAIEVFREENVGLTLYICETGAISAVLPRP